MPTPESISQIASVPATNPVARKRSLPQIGVPKYDGVARQNHGRHEGVEQTDVSEVRASDAGTAHLQRRRADGRTDVAYAAEPAYQRTTRPSRRQRRCMNHAVGVAAAMIRDGTSVKMIPSGPALFTWVSTTESRGCLTDRA